MGDSLLESGRLCAAHFCYHLADTQFGAYGSTTSKYLLLGVQNSQLLCGKYPRPEYLRKMEVFEHPMSLGKHEFLLPHFGPATHTSWSDIKGIQVPVEFGTTSTALPSEQQTSTEGQPLYDGSQQQMFNPYQNYDSQQVIEQPSQQLGYDHQMQPEVGSTLGHVYQPSIQQTAQFPPPTSEPMYSGAGYWEQQYPPQTEQYESGGSGGVDKADTPLITSQSGGNREERETKKEVEEEVKAKENKDAKNEAEKKQGSTAPEETKSGFFSYFMPWRKKSGPPRAKLPSDREPKIVWDEKEKKWVDRDADDKEEEELPAPPTDAELSTGRQQQTSTTAHTGSSNISTGVGTQPPGPSNPAPPPAANAYSRQAMNKRGARSKYVDVMNPSGSGGEASQAPPPGPPPPAMMASNSMPSFFIPQPLPPADKGEDPVSDPQANSNRGMPAMAASTMVQQPPASDTAQHTQHTQHTQPIYDPPQPSQESRRLPSVAQAPPSHGHQPGPPTDFHQSSHPPSSLTETPPSVASNQQRMPQFFNPNAFAPLPTMAGPQSDTQDDAQSTVSELSQEVSRINSQQVLQSRPRYNKFRGARVAYPSMYHQQPAPAAGHTPKSAGGPPPRHM